MPTREGILKGGYKKIMGRVGFRSGGMHAQNFQGGTVDVTVDSSGDGTASVTFDHVMKAIPAIVLTARETDTTGTSAVSGASITGFTARVDGSSVTGDTLTMSWVAFNDDRR